MPMLLLLLFSLTVTLQFQAKTLALPGPSCLKHCGDFEIQYPFGVGDGCAMKGFELNCNIAKDGRSFLTIFGTIPVRNILLRDGQVRIMKHISSTFYNRSTEEIEYSIWGKDLSDTPFRYSGNSNMFTVIGVNTLAYMTDNTHLSGCVSQSSPYSKLKAQDGKCIGAGCCQAALASDMNTDIVYFSPFYNTIDYYTNRSTTGRAEFQGYAVVMETDAFRFKTTYLNTTAFLDEHEDGRVPAILIWVVGNETCDVATTKNDSYACLSTNSMCVNSRSGSGYLCNCKEGYQGNPYLPDGCYDVDECAAEPPPCSGCKNTPGAYSCPRSLNAVELTVGVIIGIGVGSTAGFLILVVTAFFITRRFKHTRAMKLKQKYFEQNRGQLLQQLVSQRADIAERMIISMNELAKATNNFDPARELGGGGHGTVYKGILSDLHVVAIKKAKITVQKEIDEFINEVAILSQINHRNVVKILGCCLETEVPLLVYEFISNGTLYHHLHVGSPRSLSWRSRLRIASEIASAITYLHSSLSIPIIHRDIKSSNILLDDTLTSKVSDFGASRYIPLDRTGLTTVVQGTIGYLDPVYFYEGRLTDKSDVYSFGVILVELLTKKKPSSYFSSNGEGLVALFSKLHGEGNLIKILDPEVIDEGGQEVQAVAALASSCIRLRSEERPTMRQVNCALEGLVSPENHAGANNMLADEFDENGQMMMDYPSPDEGQSMGEST